MSENRRTPPLIAPMERRHIPALAILEQRCFREPWSEAALAEECGKGIFLVAEQDETVVGYVGCQVVLDEGYLTNVAVAPEYRRQGVGRALVTQLLTEAKQQRLAFVTLEVRASNVAAIALYQQLGFEPVGQRPRFYSYPTEDALLMSRFFR